MIEYPYLIALALIEQEGNRAMPLCGKSVKQETDFTSGPSAGAETLANQILLTVFQRSEKAPLRRAAVDQSLLLICIPMQLMQDQLPSLKSQWIKTGNTQEFIYKLLKVCPYIWTINYTREQGTSFNQVCE